MPLVNLHDFDIKQVGDDFVVLSDYATTEVKITFAGGTGTSGFDEPVITKEENAAFFKGIKTKVGLEVPVESTDTPRTVKLFMDHFVDLVGMLRAVPFPFSISKMEVRKLS